MRALLLSLLPLLALVPVASAGTFLPRDDKVFHGVASGLDVADVERRLGRHPDVWRHWIQWGSTFRHALDRSAGAGTRVMLHLGTAAGQNRPGRISPGEIARGEGDGCLVPRYRTLAEHGAPAYLRLMAPSCAPTGSASTDPRKYARFRRPPSTTRTSGRRY